MAGKHRGEPRSGKAKGIARFTLDPEIERELRRIMKDERRSLANLVSVLITEAITARQGGK